MTQEELTAFLEQTMDEVPDAREVDQYYMSPMLAAIAQWMHIDGEGFDRSNLVHMQLECQVLIEMLTDAQHHFADLECGATDAADEDDDAPRDEEPSE